MRLGSPHVSDGGLLQHSGILQRRCLVCIGSLIEVNHWAETGTLICQCVTVCDMKTLVGMEDEEKINLLRRMLGDAMILLHQASHQADELNNKWHSNHQRLTEEYRRL